MIESAVMLFPDPDSPTNATVSAARTSNEMSRTKGFQAFPLETEVVSFLTESTGLRVAKRSALSSVGVDIIGILRGSARQLGNQLDFLTRATGAISISWASNGRTPEV
jgi:hypothetical protein